MVETPQPTSRAVFSTAWGVVLTTAGAAIGLGNIWRFPYMMGEHGGSAFLLMYLLLVVAFGIPGLMAEYALGRHTRRGPLGAFAAASMPAANWCSGLLLLTILMAGSYYAVVLAWVLRCTTSFALATATGGTAHAFGIDDSIAVQFTYVLVTILLACGAIVFGLRRGIERLSVFGLPLFFLLFIGLIVYVLRLDGALAGLRAFLIPQLDKLTPATGLAAMGQAFFSLGLGGTIMVTYGSYMRRGESIRRVAVGTALADVGAALMAGVIIVPAVLALGMSLDTGPALMFEVMPAVFKAMPAGNVVGAIFFLSVFFVGLLSLIAAYEVLVGAAEDVLGWPRRQTAWIVLAVQAALSVPAVLIDRYIGYSDLIWGTTMMPIGSALAVVALAWFIGRAKVLEQIRRHSGLPVPLWLFYWIKYVLPIGIVTMLVYGWFDWLTNR